MKKKLIILINLFFNILFSFNLLSMQKQPSELSSQDIIETFSDKAKSAFGIFDVNTNINFSRFNLDDRDTGISISSWNAWLSRAVGFVKKTDNQDLKCLVKNAINEARCDKDGKQISTIYDLNQAVFGALKDLNSIIKTEGIATGKFNVKLLGRLKPLAEGLKNISNYFQNINISKSQKDAKDILQNLLRIYKAILDKLRNDFAPVAKDLMLEIDHAYTMVFLKQDILNGIDKEKQDLWKEILLKVQRLVFASGVESFICATESQASRCKTQDGKNIFNIFDLSAEIFLAINNLSTLNKNLDKAAYNGVKKSLAASQAIINQIKTILDKTKISPNKIDQDAKSVLLYVIQKLANILQKIGNDFMVVGNKWIGDKESLKKEIDTKFNEIFGGDLTLYVNDEIEKNKISLWDKLLVKLELFIQNSGSVDYPKIYEKEIKKKLNDIFDSIFSTKTLKDDFNKQVEDYKDIKDLERSPVKNFENGLYKPLVEKIAAIDKSVRSISTFRKGPGEVKEVLLYFVDKTKNVIEDYKSYWIRYLTKFRLPHAGPYEDVRAIKKLQ